MTMKQPDILLMMSDQHAAWYMGHEGGIVDTPNLDALAVEGTRFSNCYTACPLCVPARMSMLAGRLPTRIGVTATNHTLSSLAPTFLFPLVAAGYETVLIGRMHFTGTDLRHGFMKRIGGDVTPTGWIPPRQEVQKERGQLMSTFSTGGCLDVIGGGESPVRHFDNEIVQDALEYLAQPHEKPQFIIVGTFGPHFPYVADPALYRKYKVRGWLSPTFGETPEFVAQNPWLKAHQKMTSREVAVKAAAAYCALVEETDAFVGKVRAAFTRYTSTAGHPSVFGYFSDHGDAVGARNMYGKQTFFEDSVRVPFLLAGDGIPADRVIKDNVSLLDIGPTVCALAGTTYQGRLVDGESLTPFLAQDRFESSNTRTVISQYIESRGGASPWLAQRPGYKPEPEMFSYSVMVRQGCWKYFVYHGQEEQAVLFDMENDPGETRNVIAAHHETAMRLQRVAMEVADPTTEELEHQDRAVMNAWLRCYERETGSFIDERWKNNPPTARGQLEVE